LARLCQNDLASNWRKTLAVARYRGLEIAGLPAVDQKWQQFWTIQDMHLDWETGSYRNFQIIMAMFNLLKSVDGQSASRSYNAGRKQSSVFETTRWSVVMSAGIRGSPGAEIALEHLCQSYWYPLYAYVRRRGFGEHDAQDLTQGFFAQLFERQALERVSPSKGKFRSFLLASLNYFLSDVRDHATAQKRGGGRTVVSFQAEAAEERYQLEPVDESSPDKLFERRWALTLLDRVLDRLNQEYTSVGKAGVFDRLSQYLVENEGMGTYADAARELGQTEEAVKKAVQRMRRRYYTLFREEITSTVSTDACVEEELRYLCSVMAG
jgi:RNA polymerase sigma factor (sigma-70 family)